MRDATLADPARPGASQTPGMGVEDAITVASEGEDNGVRPRQSPRKSSAKARQNEAIQDALDTALLLPRKQNGSAARGAAANGAQTKKTGKSGESEQATLQTLQEQMNKQTDILKILLEARTRQEAHNEAMQTEISQVKEELQAVKMECQAVKDELSDTKQQMADGIAAMTAVQTSPSPSYADIIRTPPTSLPSNIRTLSSTYAASSTLTSTLYYTIDTSRVEEDASGQISAGAIRTIFFNADLVQRKIDCYGGAMAFVDDFTAWVTGPTAQSNREGIEVIINSAMEWERRSK
ncbi:hypothetical protein F5883DRAFT_691288 [Diaporthe sp. PMI_573]|nr:hypothetical protein F5883DRAFT_691288 [Diaporthaceae sp. PMI_573]